MKKISVVLLNYNGRIYLQQFLPSVVQYSTFPDVEIVLIDNASEDDSLDFVKQTYPQIKTVELDKNYGFTGGYNKGLRDLTATYFVLLNTDVEVSEGWLQPIIEYLDKHHDVAACQPKILSYNDRKSFEHAGAAGGFIDYLGYPFCRGRMIDSVEEDRGQYNQIVDVFWATGACLFIRSQVFFEAGGFDDAFFAHMEEIDLCWRLKSRGKKIVCVPDSVVYHLGGGTLSKRNPKKTYLNYRNNLLMLYKNMPDENLKKVLFFRFFLDYLSAAQMLFSGQFKNMQAVLKARSDFRKMKKDYLEIRKKNLSLVTETTFKDMTAKSLIFNYYVLGKRTFSDFFN